MNRHLIIFIKNPVLGKVKTRLSASIGKEKALSVYQDLLAQCRKLTAPINGLKYLYYSDTIADDEWSTATYYKALQKGDDLGLRMLNAITETYAKGNAKIVLIGSDCFDLQASHIEKAYDLLDEVDVVFGPANDGGYYLIGMQKPIPALFENMAWSTEDVLSESITICKREKLKHALLEELVDLDTFEDLKLSGYIPKEDLHDRSIKGSH